MPRTRIKICGITRPDDAALAQDLGADALGLNFYERSPRHIDLPRAAKVAAGVGPLTILVGLFVNPTAALVRQVLAAVPLGLLQFHGDEANDFCSQFQRPWIKAVRVQNPDAIAAEIDQYPGAQGFLLDSFVEGARGGTGQTFDWSAIPALAKPYMLAGGLTAENVTTAIRQCRPYAVDVSSGVEAAPGIKDAAKMRAFIDAVGRADVQSQDSR